MIAYYLKCGHSLEYLLNLDYYQELIFKGCMCGQHELDINEKIALNPLLKKKEGDD